MTALRRESIQLAEQMPEEQMPYIIQYINSLKCEVSDTEEFSEEMGLTPKMRAFLELEKMLVPLSKDLDYDKELAEARNEKYGYLD